MTAAECRSCLTGWQGMSANAMIGEIVWVTEKAAIAERPEVGCVTYTNRVAPSGVERLIGRTGAIKQDRVSRRGRLVSFDVVGVVLEEVRKKPSRGLQTTFIRCARPQPPPANTFMVFIPMENIASIEVGERLSPPVGMRRLGHRLAYISAAATLGEAGSQ